MPEYLTAFAPVALMITGGWAWNYGMGFDPPYGSGSRTRAGNVIAGAIW